MFHFRTTFLLQDWSPYPWVCKQTLSFDRKFSFYNYFSGGKLDRHFLLESCPLYHNLSRRACRDFQVIFFSIECVFTRPVSAFIFRIAALLQKANIGFVNHHKLVKNALHCGNGLWQFGLTNTSLPSLFLKCNIFIELDPDWHCQEVERTLKGFGLTHVQVTFGLTVLGPEEKRSDGKTWTSRGGLNVSTFF